MERKELFHKTVGILLKAYLNNTMQIGNPCGCAVGNLIVANLGIKTEFVLGLNGEYRIKWVGESPHWWISSNQYKHHEQLKSTGYTMEEVWEIESAFESEMRNDDRLPPSERKEDDEYLFLGLIKVVDTLMELHGAGEKEKAEAVSQFEVIRKNKL